MKSTLATQPFRCCLVILLLGYSTGLQLGRIAPYSIRLAESHDFDLTTIGWLTSLATLFVALFAVPAARIISSFDLEKAIRLGAVTMTAGAIFFVFAQTLELMIVARAIEAAGHIITVIAAPSYLAIRAPEELRRVFLALWSSFVPVGFALSNVIAAIVDPNVALQTIWALYAIILGSVTVLVLATLSRDVQQRPKDDRSTTAAPIAWILVLSFGVYAFLSIGFLTFLPSYDVGARSAFVPSAIVPLFVPLGSFLAAFLFARSDAGLPPRMIVLAFALVGTVALFCFPASGYASAFRALYALGCGLTAASIFTSVPVIAATDQAAARTIGAIAQAGGAMVLFGAPMAGYIIEIGSWQMLEIALAFAAFFAMTSMLIVLAKKNAGQLQTAHRQKR